MKNRRKHKTIKAYEKVLKQDKDWDFAYLYELERTKLKRMFNYFSEKSTKNIQVARQLSTCIKLLDIILEEDPVTFKFLQEYNYKPYPKYVNWRNEHRFNMGRMSLIKDDLEKGVEFKHPRIQFLIEGLRRKKAISLYHKMRIRFTDLWWD